MRGPEILARTMSIATRRGKQKKAWQYHSRSDSHSKVACWTILLDLLLECDALRSAARDGQVGFGINYTMVGPINKTLDLVVTRANPGRSAKGRRSFLDVAKSLGIALSASDLAECEALPELTTDLKDEVTEVAIALEAKACMTEHVKSLPRLHAEVLATGYLAKRAVPHCITVSYSLVNAAPTFVSPSGKHKTNRHRQPEDATRVVEMLSRAVPTLTESRDYGYDVVGAIVISCRNDGSPVAIQDGRAYGLSSQTHIHYERMIRSLCSQFRARFGR